MNPWRLEHTYSHLPAVFHSFVAPTPVKAPRLLVFNEPLAASLGLDAQVWASPEGAAILGGNAVPEGALPLAQAYAGHQFGHFTVLGDGRAILLGELVTPDGRRMDVQLKGAGPTPYSRRGDGRAAVSPMLREYVISEAMAALGIPTTRSLAVVATGEPVFRERALPGAVLTRIASSHVRVGTFEWAAMQPDGHSLRALADYTIARHYPDVSEASNPYLALFEQVTRRQAALLAQWQLVGFIHGVMNTDNMSLAGETIDYGPCAFMDTYNPQTVFSSIDAQGRYSYGNQPPIAQWNLARLAEAMLPLLDLNRERAIELATGVLEDFADRFEAHRLAGMRAKLGLSGEEEGDEALVDDLLEWMAGAEADFTGTFRMLSAMEGIERPPHTDPAFRVWHQRWRARVARAAHPDTEISTRMQRINPAVIPRNHQVEAALSAAERGDLAPLHDLLDAVAQPFDHGSAREEYTAPPAADSRAYRTFCGT